MTTSTTNGTDYTLANGVLSVNNGFSGTITSTATFNNEVQTKEIDFIYDHNGMRTGKIVSENGKVEITEYTLHGKLITHLTKRTVDENGDETTQEFHFFYDAQSKPAFVEFEDVKYRYVHNFQGDIVAIVDTVGSVVVEYKYDAYGKQYAVTGSLSNILGQLNPFRYRAYVLDAEVDLYYLKTRYYSAQKMRMISPDRVLSDKTNMLGSNLYLYAFNTSTMYVDEDGMLPKWLKGAIIGAVTAVAAVVVGTVVAAPMAVFATAAVIGMGSEVFNKVVVEEKSISEFRGEDVLEIAYYGVANGATSMIPGGGFVNYAVSTTSSAMLSEVGEAIFDDDPISMDGFMGNLASEAIVGAVDAGVDYAIEKVVPKTFGGEKQQPRHIKATKKGARLSHTEHKRAIRNNARKRDYLARRARLVKDVAISLGSNYV